MGEKLVKFCDACGVETEDLALFESPHEDRDGRVFANYGATIHYDEACQECHVKLETHTTSMVLFMKGWDAMEKAREAVYAKSEAVVRPLMEARDIELEYLTQEAHKLRPVFKP